MSAHGTSDSARSAAVILDRLDAYRALDAPTHGGRVLAYVYDSGRAELDDLAAAAMARVQAVNGLDPTAFPSVARLEADLVAFTRDALNGGDDVVGSITSGGTESCLLAVKTARDLWVASGGEGRPRLLAPVTVHAAFQKAAHYFGLALDLVPVDPATGAVRAADLIARLGPDVAIVVVSAPSYPHAALDPVAEVAAHAADQGAACHVDACIGGFALPWWPGVPAWDFRVPGVTSMSADLHKFGFAPKGASVLLHRGRDRHRAQFFATTRWPGYPVVNATLLGSKSAGPLSAAWAVVQHLGHEGYRVLTDRSREATEHLRGVVDAIPGLRVVGEPVAPLFAVAADEDVAPEARIDPHHWADAVRRRGWMLQQQPGLTQSDGTTLPRTTHLTITPVTADHLPALSEALIGAADEARGKPGVRLEELLVHLPEEVRAALAPGAPPASAEATARILTAVGIGADGTLPATAAPLTALIEALPPALVEPLLVAVIAGMLEPQPVHRVPEPVHRVEED